MKNTKKLSVIESFKLKPFNIEKALGGVPIITRGGIPVHGISRNSIATDLYKYVFYVNSKLCSCTAEGITHFGYESVTDLFIKG